jgi:uncharacterized C2H2 Zn-finger protein
MCRYSTLSLSSTECDRIRLGESAHVYTKYIYRLCRDAKGRTPCNFQVPEEDQLGSDVGSRQGRCPTCDKIFEAEHEYKLAVERATQKYTTEVTNALQKRDEEVNDASWVIETVSIPRV